MNQKMKELKERKEELQKQMKDEAKAFFKQESAVLFINHPKLYAFSWSQYTPYFNDGDTCEFRSGHEYASVVLLSGKEEFEENGPGEDEEYSSEEDAGDLEKASVDVVDFLSNFDDDDMLSLFGDHVVVTVKQDGVTVEEYEHD